MRRLLSLVVFLVLFVLGGCAEGPQPAPLTEEDMAEEPLYFEPIGAGQHSHLTDTTRVLVRDSAAWAALQTQLRPRQPFEEVDFDQVMVALVALPTRSGGYDVTFSSVLAVDTTIRIEYVVMQPGSDCITAYSPSTPFQAVLIRRAEGTPVFEERVETAKCTTSLW